MFGYNPQSTAERIDTQIAQLQQMKQQLPQANTPTAINQTFQLAPTNASLIRYATPALLLKMHNKSENIVII